MTIKSKLAAAILTLALFTLTVHAGPNRWTLAGSGKWENSNNWSQLLAPSAIDQSDSISSNANMTVTLDTLTGVNVPGSLSISNLIVLPFSTGSNLLFVANVTNSSFTVFNTATISGSGNSFSLGQLTVTNTTMVVRQTFVDDGNVVLVSANLTVTNVNPAFINIGASIPGQMTVTNSVLNAINLQVAIANGGSTLNILNGSTVNIISNFTMAKSALSSAIVSVVNATVDNSLFTTIIGELGAASFNMSSGTLKTRSLILGASPNFGVGIFNLNGGTTLVSSNMIVGNNNSNSSSTVTIFGSLYVTNATHTGVAEIRYGTLTLNTGGVFVADNLIVTNSSGNFINNGGTFSVTGQSQVNSGTNTFSSGTSVLSSNLDVGSSAGSTGIVNATAGAIVIATNAPTTIGNNGGSGALNSSNASFSALIINLAVGTNSSGMLTQLGTNSVMNISSNMTAGSGSGSTGTVMILGGVLNGTNSILGLGNNGALNGGMGFGKAVLQNASATLKGVLLGSSLGGRGQFVIKVGGTLHIPSAPSACATCGFSSNEGILDGGTIDSPGADMFAGSAHPGEMISSNGAATFRSAFIGLDNLGSLTMPGGTFNILSNLTVGSSLGATGVIVMNGGINLIGGALIIGKGGGKGHVILSSGSGPFSPGKGGGPGPLAGGGGSVLRTRGLTVSTEPGSTGTLTVSDSAATVDVYSNLVIGDCAASVAGYVEVSAGTLSVTNATGDAFLDLRDGAVTLSGGGILRVNRLVLTNSCGLFIRTGGTLIVNSMSLDPNLDADGDGIPNGYESSHGLDPLNAADANLDADGDGFTNLQEFQTGTDPTNSASAFRVTSVVPEGNNLRVTWTTGAGRTNSLQAANGAVNGGFNTNSFTDLFIVTNAVGSTTNYLDAGAVTNKPSRYYRIRLVP